MAINRVPASFFLCVLISFLVSGVHASDNSDVLDFLKSGETLYKNRDLVSAEVEFENVLLVDPSNIDAQIWLIKVYADRKKIQKARDLFEKVSKQAPSNPRLKELKGIFAVDAPKKAKQKKEPDPVIFETITLLGQKPVSRKFGFVVPEEKVTRKTLPEPSLDESGSALTLSDDPLISSNTQKPAVAEKPPAAASMPEIEAFHVKDDGPLAAAFDEWSVNGLPKGLLKYFELVMADRSLASLEDHNILSEGDKYFKPRLEADPSNEDNHFYMGMISFIGGDTARAIELLEPIRNTTKPYKELLSLVFLEFDKFLAFEKERVRIAQKEREDSANKKREETEAQAKAAAKNQAANQNPGQNTDVPLTAPPEGANTAEGFDAEGYDFYKKGRLDDAVEKFKIAIKSNPNEPKFHYHLGLAMTDKGLAGTIDSFDRAIEAFNKVIQLDPGSKLAKDAEVMVRDIVAAKSSLK
ncbi:MAG: tetratricopeptide repeat protein [Candidatus Riflebacteria bacterium]|nr:tetratricopeptide repeat protein [Candidatus Riflebacteria bacterium]